MKDYLFTESPSFSNISGPKSTRKMGASSPMLPNKKINNISNE
jgi:hypothetical protein